MSICLSVKAREAKSCSHETDARLTREELAIYSECAVLKAVDPIPKSGMVVPDSGELIVEAQLLNCDAGFVDVG